MLSIIPGLANFSGYLLSSASADGKSATLDSAGGSYLAQRTKIDFVKGPRVETDGWG
jgi:hypothetical protein